MSNGEKENVCMKIWLTYDWSMSQSLATGDFHEIEFTKGNGKKNYPEQFWELQIKINVDTY